MAFARLPDGWSVPSVFFYVNVASASADRVDRAAFARQLGAMSHRARLDGVEARMTLLGDPGAPRVDAVCPSLAWMVGRARLAPMPRLLYVADLSDLASDRRGLVATLEDLFDVDVAVRACTGLLSATGRGLAAFRAAPAPAPMPATSTTVPAPTAAQAAAPAPHAPADRAPARAATDARVVR